MNQENPKQQVHLAHRMQLWPSGKSANRMWRLSPFLRYRRPQIDQRFYTSIVTAQCAHYNRIPGFILMHLPNS
jgi:hypothetical protein